MNRTISLYCRLSALLFALVAIAHLLRLYFGLSIQVDGASVPMSVSWLAAVVPATLAAWGFRLAGGPRS